MAAATVGVKIIRVSGKANYTRLNGENNHAIPPPVNIPRTNLVGMILELPDDFYYVVKYHLMGNGIIQNSLYNLSNDQLAILDLSLNPLLWSILARQDVPH